MGPDHQVGAFLWMLALSEVVNHAQLAFVVPAGCSVDILCCEFAPRCVDGEGNVTLSDVDGPVGSTSTLASVLVCLKMCKIPNHWNQRLAEVALCLLHGM